MTETQERFLREVASRLPAERVHEVYLFAPLRQGGAETGIAVLAGEGLRQNGADFNDSDSLNAPSPAHSLRPPRFTVFTARYRLQLKGPDRGNWEVDVVEEADAPLVTVDAVVQGVQRRSGEETDVERLAGEEFLDIANGTAPWAAAT